MTAKKKPGRVREGKREPTAREREAITSATQRNGERPKRVRVEATLVGTKLTVDTPHSDRAGWSQTLQDALGTTEFDFATYTLGAVMEVMDPGGKRPLRYNAALALFGAIAPKDELEASIAAQMTAVHGLSLDCMSRAAHADTMDKRDAFVTQATKLSRTFTAQVEALTKLRSGGKQQVEVRYVYVDARGGQNIIASALGGGGQEENGRQPREPGDIARLPFAPGVPVWGEEQGGVGMSGASDAGKEAVPAARGQKPGCAEGQGQRQLQARPADAGTAGREAHDPRAGRPGEEHPQ